MQQELRFPFDLTESFPHLRVAPIAEAVINWVARAGNPVLPDKLQRELAARLPDYSQCQPQRELEIEAHLDADGATQSHRDSWHGFRLTSSDKGYIAQFNRDGMIFSRLPTYESWAIFAAEARRLWAIFVELAAPSEVQRLGVRFINRIELIETSDAARYLARTHNCLEPLGLPKSGYFYHSMHEVPGQPFQINVIETIQPASPPLRERFGLILDIDVFTTQAFQPADEIMDDYLARMRWLKNKVFFTLMSKSALKEFKKGKK